MENNQREHINRKDIERNERQESTGRAGSENLSRRVNKVHNDLDEKSSGMGRNSSGRSRGLTTKDGLTGSDYDGQVTS